MNSDFNLSEKEVVVSIVLDVSVKQKAKEGISEKLLSFTTELNELIKKHSSEDIFFRHSLGNILTHKQKVKK